MYNKSVNRYFVSCFMFYILFVERDGGKGGEGGGLHHSPTNYAIPNSLHPIAPVKAK